VSDLRSSGRRYAVLADNRPALLDEVSKQIRKRRAALRLPSTEVDFGFQ